MPSYLAMITILSGGDGGGGQPPGFWGPDGRCCCEGMEPT